MNGRSSSGKPSSQGGKKPTQQKRRRSRTVVVGATAALVLPFCYLAFQDDDDEIDYQAVCTENGTEERVDDDRCEDQDEGRSGGGYYHWYYVPAGRRAPAVGRKATGGSFIAPDTAKFSVRKGGVSASGATVSRGGFGGFRGSVGG